MNAQIINLVRPVFLGTSESYRGDIVIRGRQMFVPLYNVCLVNFPEPGKYSYVEKCVFITESFVRYLHPQESVLSFLGSNSFHVLGGVHLGSPTRESDDDEISFIATEAKLMIPQDGSISEKPIFDCKQKEALLFFQSDFARRE